VDEDEQTVEDRTIVVPYGDTAMQTISSSQMLLMAIQTCALSRLNCSISTIDVNSPSSSQ
jgi:hypothetical protein